MDLKLGSEGLILNGNVFMLTSGRGEALAQRLTINLRTHLKSWFLNENYGIDYFNRVFEKTIEKDSIDVMFRAEISRDIRVDKIINFKSRIKDNSYQLSFQVKAKDGVVSDTVQLIASSQGISFNIAR